MTLVGPFNQQPSAKYQTMEHPGALPGCCFKCRADATNRKWFVDIGLQIDFHGAAYICNMCLYEMAHTVGWITPPEHEMLEIEVQTLLEENDSLRSQVNGLRAVEESIANLVRSRGGSLDPVLGGLGNPAQLSLLPSNEQPFFDFRGRKGIKSEAGSTVGDREGEAPESSDVKGMGDIRPIGRINDDDNLFKL